MEIKQVELEDMDDVLELFCVSDPRHIRSRTYYYWRNWKSPFGKAHSYVLRLGGKPIAHYSVLPLNVQYGDKVIKIGFGQQAVVHPKYRTLRYIYNLMNEIYNYLKNDGIKLIIAFPNENFYLVKEKIMGWRTILRSTAKAYSVDSVLRKKEFSSIDLNTHVIERIQNINSSAYFPHDTVDSKNRVVFKTGWEYIKWRYFDNPENFYIIFSHKSADGRMIDGIITLKLYFDSTGKELVGHLLQLNAPEYDVKIALIYFAIKYLKEKFGVSKLVQWDFGNSFISKFLTEIEYVEEKYYVNFLGKNLLLKKEEAQDFFDVSKWYLEMHVSDVY